MSSQIVGKVSVGVRSSQCSNYITYIPACTRVIDVLETYLSFAFLLQYAPEN